MRYSDLSQRSQTPEVIDAPCDLSSSRSEETKPLRRPKAKLKRRVQHPCALDGRAGTDSRSAGTLVRVSVAPSGDGVLIESKGQATSGDQRPIVVWPVAYSIPEGVFIRRHFLCWHFGPSETSRCDNARGCSKMAQQLRNQDVEIRLNSFL